MHAVNLPPSRVSILLPVISCTRDTKLHKPSEIYNASCLPVWALQLLNIGYSKLQWLKIITIVKIIITIALRLALRVVQAVLAFHGRLQHPINPRTRSQSWSVESFLELAQVEAKYTRNHSINLGCRARIGNRASRPPRWVLKLMCAPCNNRYLVPLMPGTRQ